MRTRQLLFCVIAGTIAYSFVARFSSLEGVAAGHDSPCHVVRSAQYYKALTSEGQIPPRLAPDMGRGFGYPIHNYYPPLFDILLSVFRFIGMSHYAAMRLVVVLSAIVGGVGVAMVLERIHGWVPAAVGVVIFVWGIQATHEVYVRGGWPQFLAMALVPWIVNAVSRVRANAGMAQLAFVSALLNLAHNAATVIVWPLLALSVLVARDDWRWKLRVGMAIALGLCIASFYWVPAWFERDYVQLERMVEAISWRKELLDLSEWVHFLRMRLHEVALAVVFLLLWINKTHDPKADVDTLIERRVSLIAVLFLSISLFVHLDASSFVWELFPLLQRLQFPIRFMIVFQFGAAYAGSMVVSYVWGKSRVLACLCGVAIVVTSVGYSLQYAGCVDWSELPEERCDDRSTLVRGNWRSNWHDEYRPRWVVREPNMQTEYPILTNADVVKRPRNGPLSVTQQTLDVYMETARDVELTAIYWPGWSVMVNGNTLQTFPARHSGLLSFELPSGWSFVSVSFGKTRTQALAERISVVSVLVLASLLGWETTKRLRESSRGCYRARSSRTS